ncbi:hypothetical protein EVAR_79603_1 [Eumeta japonica]|uniref:Uncharacterized protein n=1 Tax=Eumeta variegata TaxID=151549 RepID=A0A4C1UFM2_EUMVA|nr:hypothetical protein EVAR_79603_1 [Eumeta japonica]
MSSDYSFEICSGIGDNGLPLLELLENPFNFMSGYMMCYTYVGEMKNQQFYPSKHSAFSLWAARWQMRDGHVFITKGPDGSRNDPSGWRAPGTPSCFGSFR